jgi:excinuclease UvrABC ATPase subunit
MKGTGGKSWKTGWYGVLENAGSSGWKVVRTRCTCACCFRATASTSTCPDCNGARLVPEALMRGASGRKSLPAFYALPVSEARALVTAERGRLGGDEPALLARRRVPAPPRSSPPTWASVT